MRKLLFFLAVFSLLSCSEVDTDEMGKTDIESQKNIFPQNVQLGINQAKAYAVLFAKDFKNNEIPTGISRAQDQQDNNIHDINYLIDGKDTLMYAVNYENNNGFVIISGANNSFPIIAHSSIGNINLKNIPVDNPLALVINAYKQKAKSALNDTTSIHSAYFEEWKNIGKDGYEYEVTLSNEAPNHNASRVRRGESSGKATIYPYTGMELENWCQEGGYNYYADNHYYIGCPAIAIGMLLYDTSQRMLGNFQITNPEFTYTDKNDLRSVTTGTETARKLRQIADSIPGYSFSNSGSGAQPNSVLVGLHKLGYKKAQLVSYDFETLYKNLTFKGRNYFGNETNFNRGILIGAFSPNGGGHIWFCDGYYEQSYTVTKKFIGIKVKSWKEYDDRLYMNWGWGPKGGNGWYCATDDIWTSLDKDSKTYKIDTKMFINLNYYELH